MEKKIVNNYGSFDVVFEKSKGATMWASDGKKYIDGGVYDNMPVNLLVRHGYGKMLVIRTNVENKQPKRKVEGDPDLFYIVPKEDLGPAMAFSKTRIHAYMQMGYDDAKELMDNGLREFLLG